MWKVYITQKNIIAQILLTHFTKQIEIRQSQITNHDFLNPLKYTSVS